MAGGQKGFVDFVGYPVGTPPEFQGGFHGIVDFTGVPGGTSGIVQGGLAGLLDFTGYPVGGGIAAPVVTRGRITNVLLAGDITTVT